MTEPDGPAAASTGPEGSTALDLAEHVVDSRVIHKGRYLEVRVDTVERADGTRAERDIVGHPGAVAILAIDEADRVLLVRQFRLPAKRVLLEVPAGTLDVDPETGEVEDPGLAAPRELEEETGYRARTWRKLTSFWTAPGFASELMHLYLATDLEPAHEGRLGPDEDERLELERLPFADAVAAAERGEIADAKSLVALLWLDRLTLAEPEVSTDAGATGDRIELRFRPTLREAIGAGMTAVRRPMSSKILGIAFIVLGLAGIAANIPPLATIVLLLGGFAIVTGAFIAPNVAVAAWRRRDIILPEMTVLFDANGADYAAARSRAFYKWELFRQVRESGRYFFLETGLVPIYIPKRAFAPEQLMAFRRLLAEAGFGPDGRRAPATSPRR